MPDNRGESPATRGRWFRSRRILLPTWRICLPLLALAAFALWLAAGNLYSWLSASKPLGGSPSLVVEGWLPDYALLEASSIARQRQAPHIYCTGIPLDRGTLTSSYETYADYAAAVLEKTGIPSGQITAAPAPGSMNERTRSMARALRERLQSENIPAASRRLNLVTFGTHARRSHRIFREELGPGWQVGVISLPDREIDPGTWYLQSRGAKAVLEELIALGMGILGAN